MNGGGDYPIKAIAPRRTHVPRRLGASDDRGDGPKTPFLAGDGDLTAPVLGIRVEVYDETDSYVEQVVAITANRSIGFAAYYCAKEQYPGRTIVLRDSWGVISRWPARRH